MAEDSKTAEAKPDWLPPKFNSPEEMAKSYAELEKKLGSSAVPPKAEAKGDQVKTEDLNPDGTKPAPVDPKVEAKADTPVMQKFHEEFAQKGELAPESYAELEKLGHSKAVVDTYIQSMKANAEKSLGEIYSITGDQGGYTDMVKWAGENLSEAEINAYDAAVTGTNQASIKLAVQGLYAQYRKANPSKPSAVRGDNGRFDASTPAYQSMAQVTADMKNPLYKTDEAFRAKVAARLSKSNI